jgi:Domain of unknown function (DU1801)
MAENKTKPTDASVEDYILSRASEQQRTDCHELMALLEKVTQHSPKMWGPSIVGYGSYRYTYESGRTGEAPLAGFAIRGRQLVVYLVAEGDRQKFLLSKLSKHNIGKSCLYFKKLADLDPSVLEQLVAGSVAEVTRSSHHQSRCLRAETTRDGAARRGLVASHTVKRDPQARPALHAAKG